MREAIVEVIACFPVYRTYVSARGVSDEDRRIVQWAVNVARRRSAVGEISIFDFLRDVLLCDAAVGKSDSYARAIREFAMKFQQVTSPVTAKGVEDTAYYRHNRLVAINEVGADPRRFAGADGLDAFEQRGQGEFEGREGQLLQFALDARQLGLLADELFLLVG